MDAISTLTRVRGGIEKNPSITTEINYRPISATTAIVVIRTRGEHKVDVEALTKSSVKFMEHIAAGDITSVVFFHDVCRPLADIAKLIKCGGRIAGQGCYAFGHGGVWHNFNCIGKDCKTPCRDEDCSAPFLASVYEPF